MAEDITYAGEKPVETWEERFDKEFDDITHLDCDGVKDGIKCETMANDVKSFIAKEIKSAVEADRKNYPRKTESDFWWYEKGADEERRRIMEVVKGMKSEGDIETNLLDRQKILSIINPKK